MLHPLQPLQMPRRVRVRLVPDRLPRRLVQRPAPHELDPRADVQPRARGRLLRVVRVGVHAALLVVEAHDLPEQARQARQARQVDRLEERDLSVPHATGDEPLERHQLVVPERLELAQARLHPVVALLQLRRVLLRRLGLARREAALALVLLCARGGRGRLDARDGSRLGLARGDAELRVERRAAVAPTYVQVRAGLAEQVRGLHFLVERELLDALAAT
ncbi:hypothetical protein GSI_01229 [Ganoderma sinense ZZ0214-1]|uniref:Uncharacterized protein n=1 Tax=Ganoderma sinense ZZ0214-1 TaxID=1077348 RepID=A0A2G8SUT2_9APHY|nr:hypothetical protein GSI_01229 [Ganoderma sinense ZZ0214-1]